MSPETATTSSKSVAGLFDRLLAAWFLMATAFLAMVALAPTPARPRPITEVFYLQDLPLLLAGGVVLGLIRLVPPPALGPLQPRLFGRWAMVIAAAVTLVGVLGTRYVYAQYHLSMDEFAASFDAAIFARGDLIAPLPPEWREFFPALQPNFFLATSEREYWHSAYLPVNALIQSLGVRLGAADLVNPAWLGVSVLALYSVGRRLWPQSPAIAFTAAALLATSTQFLAAGFTAYAMPAHLALNLLWLSLLLRGGWAGHLGAALTALAATGLHQIFVHPLFAAPFVLQLWLDRRWAAAGFHTCAYAVFGLVWLNYRTIVYAVLGVDPMPGGEAGSLVNVVIETTRTGLDPANLDLMGRNLLRAMTWQNVLVAPLAILGARAAWREGGMVRALVLSIALVILVRVMFLPFQGHGWGYRYLHGYLGALCLLAALSLARFAGRFDAAEQARIWTAAGCAIVFSALVQFPVRADQIHRFVQPYADATRFIAAAEADVVMVDGVGFWYGVDLVRNDPYLESQPVVLDLESLSGEQVSRLCNEHDVRVFDRADAARFGMHVFPHTDSPRAQSVRKLRDVMAEQGCGGPIRR